MATLTTRMTGPNEFLVEQVNVPTLQMHSLTLSDNRIPINVNFGPVSLNGWVDLGDLSISVTVSVVGISIGTFYGNLKDGIGINVNVVFASGSIRLYLKNGNEVWVKIDVKIPFTPGVHIDEKIFTLPIGGAAEAAAGNRAVASRTPGYENLTAGGSGGGGGFGGMLGTSLRPGQTAGGA